MQAFYWNLTFIVIAAILLLFCFKKSIFQKNPRTLHIAQSFLPTVRQIGTGPLLMIFIAVVIFLSYRYASNRFDVHVARLDEIVEAIARLLGAIGIFWLAVRLINLINAKIYAWLRNKNYKTGESFLNLIDNSLKILFIILLLNLLVPFFPVSEKYTVVYEKSATIFLILGIAAVAVQFIKFYAQLIMNRHVHLASENFNSRRVLTQIVLLKKILYTLVIILGVAGILMIFDRLRELGTALLASAGIIAAIATFAAQKSIGGLFASLQVAITQPIRLNDQVVVEGEFGIIEEINFNYVIVKIWDLRRLVVPIAYFLEKPFQTWTRRSTQLIGIVMIYTDYTAPIDALRKQFHKILNASNLWDKDLAKLQVSEARENVLQLRITVTAANAGDLWNLRCEVREKMVTLLSDYYPESLPKIRISPISDPVVPEDSVQKYPF